MASEQMERNKLEELIQRLFDAATTGNARCKEITSGVVYPYEDDATGRQVVEGSTEDGPFRIIGSRVEDIQANSPGWEQATAYSDGAETAASICAALHDPRKTTEDREQLLRQLISLDNGKAATIIVEEIEKASDARWREVLVLAAEDMQFRLAGERKRLKIRLLEVALSLRHDSATEAERTAFSAIRCYASLIEQAEIATLLPLLDPPVFADTRLVALQSIIHALEHSPPLSAAPLGQLANRVAQLAETFLHPDLLLPGEVAAIAQNAIQLLAMLGDDRAHADVIQVTRLNKRWLTRQLKRKLEKTLEMWKRANQEVVQNTTFRKVADLLTLLG
jgi:hypothetical protein